MMGRLECKCWLVFDDGIANILKYKRTKNIFFEKVIYHTVTRLSKRMLTKFILNEKTIFVREEIMEVMTANTEMTAVTYST